MIVTTDKPLQLHSVEKYLEVLYKTVKKYFAYIVCTLKLIKESFFQMSMRNVFVSQDSLHTKFFANSALYA